ncbi:TPA: plasmid recombination protein [Enterococcus faecium]|nr:plasmid recombination protein [Enterococcus faecium]
MEVFPNLACDSRNNFNERKYTVMAYMVARTQKHKVGSLNGLQNHVDCKTKNHTNKDIDITKSGSVAKFSKKSILV